MFVHYQYLISVVAACCFCLILLVLWCNILLYCCVLAILILVWLYVGVVDCTMCIISIINMVIVISYNNTSMCISDVDINIVINNNWHYTISNVMWCSDCIMHIHCINDECCL